jgi:hypothetical protein
VWEGRTVYINKGGKVWEGRTVSLNKSRNCILVYEQKWESVGGEKCILAYEQMWESEGGKNCIVVYEQKWESAGGENRIHKQKWESAFVYIYSSSLLHFPTLFIYHYTVLASFTFPHLFIC